MKTTWYWTVRHISRALYDMRWRAACWWLRQRVDFLEWRMRLDTLLPVATPEPVPVRQGGRDDPYGRCKSIWGEDHASRSVTCPNATTGGRMPCIVHVAIAR